MSSTAALGAEQTAPAQAPPPRFQLTPKVGYATVSYEEHAGGLDTAFDDNGLLFGLDFQARLDGRFGFYVDLATIGQVDDIKGEETVTTGQINDLDADFYFLHAGVDYKLSKQLGESTSLEFIPLTGIFFSYQDFTRRNLRGGSLVEVIPEVGETYYLTGYEIGFDAGLKTSIVNVVAGVKYAYIAYAWADNSLLGTFHSDGHLVIAEAGLSKDIGRRLEVKLTYQKYYQSINQSDVEMVDLDTFAFWPDNETNIDMGLLSLGVKF